MFAGLFECWQQDRIGGLCNGLSNGVLHWWRLVQDLLVKKWPSIDC
ncbi:hypothetical protein [Rubritalea tangerina]